MEVATSHAHVEAFSTVNGMILHYEPQLDYFGREGSGFKIVSFDPRGYGAQDLPKDLT